MKKVLLCILASGLLLFAGCEKSGSADAANTHTAEPTHEIGDMKMTHSIPDKEWNSGYTMPAIGLGTWTLSNEEAEECVYHALTCGMRLIDTARYYQCEIGVGRGIQRAIDEGLVTREEVFVTSTPIPQNGQQKR